ncbi:lysophospholipid acyltransferase family protein [Rhabdochromatium marinum]|uniref:lysophospholipid acyltransferase family protein n=1 Tax=Rhabdochromatium marinum TaxID=48729 RepID=UPI001902FDB6|nr:lysophospholipid acyltransferase family protein [Rhabdochromatium marinum]MBK1649104.1 lipid A biosynthesis acyltransferase [Rhabdochromatium marinum]
MCSSSSKIDSDSGPGWHPRHWASWLLLGLLQALGRLPLPLLFALGQGLGALAYPLSGARRQVALTNVRCCFPDLEAAAQRRLVRAHLRYLAVAALAQGIGWSASRARLRRLVRILGRERIDACCAAGRPVIVLVPHFIGLELGGAAFTALVHPGMYMYQRIRNPVLDWQVKRARTRFGGLPVEHRDDLRAMVRELKRGTPFFYLPDQDAGKRRGVFAPFCGQPASTVATLGRLARLADAEVIPLFARFLPWGRGVELRFAPPIEGLSGRDPVADAARMNQVIEAEIHRMPEQYFWVHRRFKTRPPGMDPLYPQSSRRRRQR